MPAERGWDAADFDPADLARAREAARRWLDAILTRGEFLELGKEVRSPLPLATAGLQPAPRKRPRRRKPPT